MALTYPLSLDDFFSRLPIESATPDLGEDMEMNWNGRGEILTADLGERLWRMDIALAVDRYDALEGVKARLHGLRQAGRSLIVHAMPLFYPQYDPDGAILGNTLPTLKRVDSNHVEIDLAGLPPGYVISDGDYLSFNYGSNPMRYAFHQVQTGSTAGGQGVASDIQVVPHIQAGFALNASVRLVKPRFKAVIIPDTARPGTSAKLFTRDAGFSVMQTYR